MVNTIIIMLISDITANAFLCLRLLDASAKVLVGACKGVDVTPERLSKRYAEVHSAIGGLISGGFAALPLAFVHTSATDERLLAIPLSTADAARRVRRLLGSSSSKSGSAFVANRGPQSNEPTPLPVPETPRKKEGKRFEFEDGDPLSGVDFAIPSDALPPPPARAVGARRRPPAPPRVAPAAPPTVFKGAVDENADGKVGEVEGFGAFGPVELIEAEKSEQGPVEEGGWEAEFEEEGPDEEPAGPSLTLEDLREALQLVEIYTAEVANGRLKSGGILGAVRRRLAPYGLEAALFRLQPSETLVVNACLQTAARNKFFSSPPDAQYGYLATLSGAPMDCAYVHYKLPAVACAPPIVVDFAVAPQSSAPVPGQPAPFRWEALLLVRIATNPELSGPLLDVVVDVDLPPELPVLVKASPSAQWSPNECRLRWSLGKLMPGSAHMTRAIVAAKPGTGSAGAEAALREASQAKLYFTGSPGTSLSGTGFEVAMADEKETRYSRGRAVWFGEMVVKP